MQPMATIYTFTKFALKKDLSAFCSFSYFSFRKKLIQNTMNIKKKLAKSIQPFLIDNTTSTTTNSFSSILPTYIKDKIIIILILSH